MIAIACSYVEFKDDTFEYAATICWAWLEFGVSAKFCTYSVRVLFEAACSTKMLPLRALFTT